MEEEEELEAGRGTTEEASLLGGEGVRARTSTTFRSAEAEDAVVEEEEDEKFIATTAPEPGDSERLAIPTARVAATQVLCGDDDLERGTDSTTFNVEDNDNDGDDDAEGTDDDAEAESLCGAVESDIFAYH